ncbi:MAG: MFS transporter [Flavobacteriales bacterium]|nr:MFS transporter [Flavobacteriales bacterium]MAJ97901.1 MFS transporter [Flavobacteriales bacterium]|tara:strand:- start:2808 stop:4058 length:1251 start_codon:yes stop_codon:yes gene_type:complete
MKKKSILNIILLILAAETVFMLPYIISRVFRPTVLELFEISNTELGICFSTYGFVAILSYLIGGPLADRYPPRKLMSTSLILTSLGGLYYANYPGFLGLKILYAYWGFTTVFLFWSPMIKATRIWGDNDSQTLAFGLLEGGRGIIGAIIASVCIMIFSLLITEFNSKIDLQEKREAFSKVIFFTSFFVASVSILVWKYMKFFIPKNKNYVVEKFSFKKFKSVQKLYSVRLIMVIILCAYVGYKTTDIISLYANKIMDYNEVESAKISTFLLYLRPTIAILIAIFLSKFKATIMLIISFTFTLIGSLFFSLKLISINQELLFLFSTTLLGIGIYSARTLYFSVMKRGNIPINLTGTAVGFISIIGYTPDIFSGPLYGYFLDQYSGIKGQSIVFTILTIFSFIGIIASIKFYNKFENS